MEMPIKRKSFMPEPEKRTIPRQSKTLFERNSIGRRYLGEVYGVNDKKFRNKNRPVHRLETLEVIKENFKKEEDKKNEKWQKRREHQGKYTDIMRSIAKKVSWSSIIF